MSANRVLSVSVLAVLMLCTVTNPAAADTCTSAQPCERYHLQYFYEANWQQAVQACGYMGMRLASITSAADQAALEYQIAQHGMKGKTFWVSGTSMYGTRNDFWWANGRPVTYNNWAAGEPNASDDYEQCIQLLPNNQQWNDNYCLARFNFVCEKIN